LTGFPYVLVLPQQALEEVLRTELEKRGCKVDWSHRLAGLEEEGDVVRASVERLSKESTGYSVARTEWVVDKTLQIEASFVVGADGHRSVVRRLADIEFEDLGSSNVFAVFEFDTDSDAGSELQLVLDEGTTSVLWPMANGRFRWSFEIANAQEQTDARIKSRLLVQLRDEPYPYVTEDELTRLIRDRAPWFTPQTREVVWSAAIRFEKRLASTFGRDRVWLAGDAAHLALPIGIQSMNIGLREAKKLGRNLADILSRRGGWELLETYNRGRLTEWTRLLSRQTAPIPQLEADEWITQRATRISQCLPASGRDLTTLLEKLGLQLSAD
jgi:2-polyprenyl-6-methoxyphenol hydroxylase-like FAD-dependent oxidoreductase